MLDSFAPARRRMLLAALAVVGLALVGVFGAVAVDRVSSSAADQNVLGPVVVVPGYGGQVVSVEPLAAALRAAGREVVVLQPDEGGTGDLIAQAEKLDAVARAAMEDVGTDSVDIIGYSAGGVVARIWVRDQGGAEFARRVLSIGSPQHGTDVAALAVEIAGSCPIACQQLAPDSDLLRKLNAGDETPDGPLWITVRSTADQVVVPSDSAALDGALDIVVQEFCPDQAASHSALPGDSVVLATVASALGAAAPRIPVDARCAS